MKNELIKIIKDSTEIMFYNFYVTLITCDMNYELCGMHIWKHCYHTLTLLMMKICILNPKDTNTYG